VRLFSYKLHSDTGFAPNPFWGVLTLATCKPQIRKSKRAGDWIAGFTSNSLCGDHVGEERLLYLMQITDKLPIAQYFLHPDFQYKIPDLTREEFVYQAGDNIYKQQDHDFLQIPNRNHIENDTRHDVSGEFVLVSTWFYYFGISPIKIPENVRPAIPRGQSAHGSLTHDNERASMFVTFVMEHYQIGVHDRPHTWPNNDVSWRSH